MFGTRRDVSRSNLQAKFDGTFRGPGTFTAQLAVSTGLDFRQQDSSLDEAELGNCRL